MYGVVITPFFMSFYKLHHLVLIYIYYHEKWYMKKGGKNMKKIIVMLVLVVMLIGACCSCSLESEEPTEVPQEILDENPMFVYMGDSIEIAGETYSASQFREGYYSTQGKGYFVVNRINRQVYYIFTINGGSRSGLGHSINTGLIYEGLINGLPEVPIS